MLGRDQAECGDSGIHPIRKTRKPRPKTRCGYKAAGQPGGKGQDGHSGKRGNASLKEGFQIPGEGRAGSGRVAELSGGALDPWV